LYADDKQSGYIPAATPVMSEETSEDVALSKPATPKAGVKRKKTARLLVKKTRIRLSTPPRSTPSYGVSPMKVKISPLSLTPETIRIFFESISSLLNYVNATERTVDLKSFNGRIKQLAYYELFPPEPSLSELVGSMEKEDIKVSWSVNVIRYLSYIRQLVKCVRRSLKLILDHLKKEEDCERLVDEELTLEAIRRFREQCGRYLQLC